MYDQRMIKLLVTVRIATNARRPMAVKQSPIRRFDSGIFRRVALSTIVRRFRTSSSGFTTRGLSLALFLLCSLLAHDARAFLREIKPGDDPDLSANEGLLLISVDTPWFLRTIRIQREGNVFTSAQLHVLAPGVTTKLYAAPIGRYRWDRVEMLNGNHYELADDAELKFELKAGVINYPGDLLFRPSTFTRARLRTSNHGLAAIDWLEKKMPDLYARYNFHYVGNYPDPFPDFYRKARAAHPDRKLGELSQTRKAPSTDQLPLAVDQLWKPSRFGDLALNAAGDLLAEEVNEDGKHGVDLIDLKSSEAIRLLEAPIAIHALHWVGNRTLIVAIGDSADGASFLIFHITSTAKKAQTFVKLSLPFVAHWVGSTAQAPPRIFVASLSSRNEAMVHAIDITDQDSIRHSPHGWGDRMNKGLQHDVAWQVDTHGDIRVVLTIADGHFATLYGEHGKFAEVLRGDDDDTFIPYGLSPDGGTIYAITDRERAQRELVAFDPNTRTIVKTLFAKPGIDVSFGLFNAAGSAIGAGYYQTGHLASEYFDADNQQIYKLLENTFPDKSVVILSRDDAGNQFIVGVDGTDRPFAIYRFDREQRTASLIDESLPALATQKWAPSHVIRAQGIDDLPIEAYLTLPKATGKLPVVVLAHGGPMGISDKREFDPEVQFLASLGYAVLQVNFRGSGGYGRAYREAGRGAHGGSIEDDIDSALQVALSRFPLDEKRMCAMGTSYGGYSALISAVRWPERYRCAISISGVSDRILFFTASDAAHTAAGRRRMEKYIDDPNTELERIYRTSPLYRYEELKTPLLLVHGVLDERVDFEHTLRLSRMLNLAGRSPALIELPDEGHGVYLSKNIAKVYPAIAAFLREHLDAASSADAAKP
jgi:acetyl esterase/lipase